MPTPAPQLDYWRHYWQHVATDHARQAAQDLYPIGVFEAHRGKRVLYADAGDYLHKMGRGYGGRRSVLPLDALAGLCADLGVPDLSSVFWSRETIAMTAASDPDAYVGRWARIQDKEAEEASCHRNLHWADPHSA